MPSAIDEPARSGTAPSYDVPQHRVVSIEHPCIVNNFDNGFKSLGYEHQLKHVLAHEIGGGKKSDGSEPVAVASLRPHHPFAKKLSSTASATHNVLIKVSLPKRTGRKRKRGSNRPFEVAPVFDKESDSITAADLVSRLRDNANNFTMEAVGTIEHTHSFKGLPDFQMRADGVPIMREMRDHVMNPDYEQLRRFSIKIGNSHDSGAEIVAPPSFIPAVDPYKYEYKQMVTDESAVPKQKKRTTSGKIGQSMLESGISLQEGDEVPQGPAPDLKMSDSKLIKTCLKALHELLKRRPIITIRAAEALLSDHSMKALSQTVQYVGYYVNKGPWEGAIVKYGVDPRSDPKYRIYQTLQFQIKHQREMTRDLKRRHTQLQHEFDGKSPTIVGKYWQLCDFSEPQLASLLNTDEIREACDENKFGWYFNGTIAKIRVILLEQLGDIVNGDSQSTEDDHKVLAALPNRIDVGVESKTDFSQSPHLRQLVRSVEKEAKGPRKFYHILRRPLTGSIGKGAEMDDEDDGAGSFEDEAGDDGAVGSPEGVT